MIVTGKVVIAEKLPASRKDESNALMVLFVKCASTHGEPNVDCVAVWFPCVTALLTALARGSADEAKRWTYS